MTNPRPEPKTDNTSGGNSISNVTKHTKLYTISEQLYYEVTLTESFGVGGANDNKGQSSFVVSIMRRTLTTKHFGSKVWVGKSASDYTEAQNQADSYFNSVTWVTLQRMFKQLEGD